MASETGLLLQKDRSLEMNEFPRPYPVNSDGMVLRNVRCLECGRLQWSYGNCRVCSGKVRQVENRHG